MAIITSPPAWRCVRRGAHLQGVMLEDIVREIGDDLAIEHQLYYPQNR